MNLLQRLGTERYYREGLRETSAPLPELLELINKGMRAGKLAAR